MAPNIWVAAGDGLVSRVAELIEQHGVSPNVPDENFYTPMHAAASYGRLDVLAYLVSHGGDVNITDGDGDTPLFTVEDIPTARFLLDHGANVNHRNNDGLSPMEHLAEDFPGVADFLEPFSDSPSPPAHPPALAQPSQHAQNLASEQLTTDLLQSVHSLLDRAAVDGRDPDDDLHDLVRRAVLTGVLTGYRLSANENGHDAGTSHPTVNGHPSKRPRTDYDSDR